MAKTENSDGVLSADQRQELADKCLLFVDILSDHPLRPYQSSFARRVIESVLFEDLATVTALWSRQGGKSEAVCNTVAALLVLLPRLAKIYPKDPVLSKFRDGFWVGIFAPVEEQANTLFGRLTDRLTSEHAQSILSDPDIDDQAVGKSKQIKLKRCGSYALMMTANPRAKIESKTFHLVCIDEAQDADDYIVEKSIGPMMAATAGTSIRTGTPTTRKGSFYNAIQYNKQAALAGRKQNHFEANWKEVGKYNPSYLKYVMEERDKLTEESDMFQMSYNLRWILDRGMFTTETRMDELGDTSMQELVKSWTQTPVVVGIDPAKTVDSTVVTVVWVDWDRPDEFGLYPHRVLNWLELRGSLEEQYHQIVNFLEPYSLYAVAVDNQGMGIAVSERMRVLLRHKSCEIVPMNSTASDQNLRWKHLTTLMDRGLISWPAGARVRRLNVWKRFFHEMTNAEKSYVGPNIKIEAPKEAGAHDDYPDSLALACYLTADLSAPTMEVITNPFF